MFYDYYKLLNIDLSTNSEEIKEAYNKKLQFITKSYDKSSDDYLNLFNLLTQAYHTLTDVNVRTEYDNYYKAQISPKTNYFISNLKPQIHYFKIDNHQVEVGETVKIYWHTSNCDQVILLPIGPVKTQGELIFNINSSEDRFSEFSLLAENTVNGHQETKELKLSPRLNDNANKSSD